MNKTIQNLILTSALVAMIFTIGCGKADVRDKVIGDLNKNNIQRLANLYTYYQARNKWEGPTDEADFKEFIKQVDTAMLTRIGTTADSVDDLFICERDNEPFQIKYGIPTGPHGSSEAAIFEKTGVSGKRMIAFLNQTQREVESSEYDTLFGADVGEEVEVTRSDAAR